MILKLLSRCSGSFEGGLPAGAAPSALASKCRAGAALAWHLQAGWYASHSLLWSARTRAR